MTKDLRDMPFSSVSAIVVTRDRKDQTLRCIHSLLAQEGDFSLEVVVVDNASSDGTLTALANAFGSRVRVVRNETNRMAAGGRNDGAKVATGNLLLFLDSDNVARPGFVAALADILVRHPNAGMAGCVMTHLDPSDRIWCAGADISLLTGRTHYRHASKPVASVAETEPYETGHLPNAFMVRATDFRALGGFYEPYGIMFEESDLAERIRHSEGGTGRKILVDPRPLDAHDVPLITDGSLRAYGLQSPFRARLLARNRNLFMRRNAHPFQRLAFFTLFWPLYTAYYLRVILSHHRPDIAKAYLKGAIGESANCL